MAIRLRLGRSRRAAEELARGRAYVEGYSFPSALRTKIAEARDPELSPGQVGLVLEGLRSWFLACLYARGKLIGMPSKAVDGAWHEFILITRDYHEFCENAFGRYLHHTPDAAMSEPMSEALARTARTLDRYPEARGPHAAAGSLPLLFAVDELVGIDEGHRWTEESFEELRRGSGSSGGWGDSGTATAGGDGDGHHGGGDGGSDGGGSDGGGGDGGGCGGGCGGS